MKLTHYIYISTALAALAACSDDDMNRVYTVGEANNAIVLRAGLSDKKPLTRAYDGNHKDTSGDITHKTFVPGTQLLLRVDGTWTEHQVNGEDASAISQKTVATVGEKITLSTDDDVATHNKINGYAPVLYWDDYGTADPANKGTGKGRETGLTIYGVAVNDVESTVFNAPTAVTDWENIAWNVGEPTAAGKITSQSSGILDKDLLTSNNIRPTSNGGDGTLKFDDIFDGIDATVPSNLLEFTHAMTKVTVNLYAGAGFSSAFEEDPSVTLKDFYYEGTVDVIAETSTPDNTKKSDIYMHLMPGGGSGKPSASFEALVFPKRKLTGTETILSFTADGNNFDVTSAKLFEKMPAEDGGKTMLRGTNYIINITVNKTKIEVEATIKDWENVEAAMDYPVINVSKIYGHEGYIFTRTFDFLRSTDINGSYLADGNTAVVSYDNTDSKYIMTNQLYWPNHSIHYFFRGVWPNIGSLDGEENKKGPSTTDFPTGGGTISVSNVAYKQGYYPSDLMIGFPRVSSSDGSSDEVCKLDTSHKDGEGNAMKGICATTGEIRMNFRYVMSQVIVNLETSKDAEGNPVANSVVFDENTKVEILNAYNSGSILLADGSAQTTGETGEHFMARKVTNPETYTTFHDAIIPQNLTNTTGDLKFRITVKNSDDTYDVYETVDGIKGIKVKEQNPNTSAWGELGYITAWAPGKKYTYTLTITKTDIKIIATITDWITVTGSTEIWM